MSKKRLKQHLHASDIRGLAQLATTATTGVVCITEGVHQSVLKALGVPGGGIVSLVYQSVCGVTRLVGKSVDTLLANFQSQRKTMDGTPERAAAMAILNGVLGDGLEANHNPLAIPMTLRYRGDALDWAELPDDLPPTGHVLLLIHGLCMNDLQWSARHQGRVVNHGEALAAELGAVPLYLRYNTGRHISQNGHDLSALLQQLIACWPGPLNQITMVTHSMGGLVARSAIHSARLRGLSWARRVDKLVFLGTPHHGAPLERAGNWVDHLLASSPFTAPFSALGKVRSAGITDLRYGHVLDEDWHGRDRFQRQADSRQPLPLPEAVACYTIAASLAAGRTVADELVGDGLVLLRSALGQHPDPRFHLTFDPAAQWVAYRTSHLGLLSNPEVTAQLTRWLAPGR